MLWTAIYSIICRLAPLQVHSICTLTREPKQPLQVVSEALIDEHVNEGINARVEGDNYDADDVYNVSILLWVMKVIQHVDD